MEEYRRQMLTETSDPQGILVVDDTGFPKKGSHSVCVARQYCGALGKVENCQIGVSLTYVGQGVAWPYGMDLFFPRAGIIRRIPSESKRQKTQMPETSHHREKWRMALELIDLAREAGVPHRGVVADSWYGNVVEFPGNWRSGKNGTWWESIPAQAFWSPGD